MKKITSLVLTLISAAPLVAQNWTGAISSDWNNPANWSANPTNGGDIMIDPANYTGLMAEPVVTGPSSFTPGKINVQNGSKLTISGTLNAGNRVGVIGQGAEIRITTGGSFSLNGAGNNARLIFVDDAHLQMDGGLLNVGQRLLFEFGSTGEVNAGTVVVGETLALVDGSNLGSSRLVQNGGTITTNEEFGFENEEGIYFPTFEQTGGSLYVNGSLLWLGAAPGAGRGYLRSTGGTIQVTGTVGNEAGSTMGMHIELSGNNTLFENVGNAVTLLAGDSIIVRNGAEWRDILTVSWQSAGVFHASADALFQSGNSTISGTGSYQFGKLTVPGGKSFVHTTPQVVAASGDLLVNGVFNHNANELILNGTQPQSVSGLAGLSFHDLEVANESAGVELVNNLSITHHLELTDGIVTVLPGATLKIGNNATVAGGTDTTFVAGYMEKTGNQAIEFPLGSAPGRYRPLSVSAPASASTVIRTAYKHSTFPILTPVEAPLQTVSTIEYWDLSRTGSADLFSAGIGWNDASESGLTDCANLSLSVWNGTQWAFVASTIEGLCDGTGAGTLAAAAALPAVGPLTIGFMQNVTQNPVEICAGTSFSIGSSTYSTSGVYIDILEDINGNDSTVVTILTVKAPIVTTVTNHTTYLAADATGASYQWIDCNDNYAAIAGETQFEFHPAVNGSYAVIITIGDCSDTSACTTISQLGLKEHTAGQVSLSPNPTEGNGKLAIRAAAAIGFYEIRIPDGRTVAAQTLEAKETQFSIALPELPAGVYLLMTGSDQTISSTRRFVVK